MKLRNALFLFLSLPTSALAFQETRRTDTKDRRVGNDTFGGSFEISHTVGKRYVLYGDPIKEDSQRGAAHVHLFGSKIEALAYSGRTQDDGSTEIALTAFKLFRIGETQVNPKAKSASSWGIGGGVSYDPAGKWSFLANGSLTYAPSWARWNQNFLVGPVPVNISMGVRLQVSLSLQYDNYSRQYWSSRGVYYGPENSMSFSLGAMVAGDAFAGLGAAFELFGVSAGARVGLEAVLEFARGTIGGTLLMYPLFVWGSQRVKPWVVSVSFTFDALRLKLSLVAEAWVSTWLGTYSARFALTLIDVQLYRAVYPILEGYVIY